jgi:hypothetical protein
MTARDTTGSTLVWSGSGPEAGSVLDQLLASGRFDESDIVLTPGRPEVTIVFLVPDYEDRRPSSEGGRFSKSYQVPLHRYVVTVVNASRIEIHDESQTYAHRVFAVRYNQTSGELLIEANPPFSIRVMGAREASVEIFRGCGSADSGFLRTVGPIEIE